MYSILKSALSSCTERERRRIERETTGRVVTHVVTGIWSQSWLCVAICLSKRRTGNSHMQWGYSGAFILKVQRCPAVWLWHQWDFLTWSEQFPVMKLWLFVLNVTALQSLDVAPLFFFFCPLLLHRCSTVWCAVWRNRPPRPPATVWSFAVRTSRFFTLFSPGSRSVRTCICPCSVSLSQVRTLGTSALIWSYSATP